MEYLKLFYKVANFCVDDWSVVKQSALDITYVCKMKAQAATRLRQHSRM